MIATLPMYDRPETEAANDRLWQAVRERLGRGPEKLNREIDLWEAWRHPDLVLSQTCGLPFSMELHGKVSLVGSPDFNLPGCPPGYYCSLIIARAKDNRSLPELLSARPVINQSHSQSGHGALRRFALEGGYAMGAPRESGGHRMSARMVAEGEADIAAIDANTWRSISRWDSHSADLRVIAQTRPTPAMPYICAPRFHAVETARALAAAIAELTQEDRDLLGVQGLVFVPAEAFLAVPRPEFA